MENYEPAKIKVIEAIPNVPLKSTVYSHMMKDSEI